MKRFMLALLFMPCLAFSADYISIEEAASHKGEQRTVCGVVTQTVTQKGFTYVNFGGRYPNQVFHLFITKPHNYKNLSSLNSKKVCAYGEITMYRNKPEITDPDSINIME